MEYPTSPEPSPAPSPASNGAHAPDFQTELGKAQQTGDFDFVLDTALKSKKMLIEFRDAIHESSFLGRSCAPVAMGLNFLQSMINNSSQQLAMLKQTAKATQEAIKATRGE